jgi:two-component system chemotaxis sensor kinase CheA
MSNNNQQIVEELVSIIQLLADVWPNDRENVAVAGAKFEGIIESFDQNYGQIQKLSSLSWEGIKYLYEKEDFFMTVKATTMQAINVFREYILSDGDVKVEDFEKAFDELQNALEGDGESADSVISEEELEQLQATDSDNEITKEEKVEHLATIIQLIADVWPNDRENVAKAGGQFEEIFESLVKDSSQIKKLASLTWEGLKYLYEKDEYFMTVKSSTMHAVNTFREYIISDGDLQVEDFEKAYDELEKALHGDGESADTVIELSEEEIEAYQEKEAVEKNDAQIGAGLLPPETSIDDLASYIMMLDEESATKDQIERLAAFLLNSINNESDAVSTHLKEAYKMVSDAFNGAENEGWLSIVSVKIEAATVAEENQEWEASQEEVESEPVIEEESTIESEPVAEEEVVELSEKEQVEEVSESKGAFIIPEDIDVSLVAEFITECSELIEAAEGALLDLEDRPEDMELVNTVFRAYHTIKGTSAFMGLDPITEFTHFVETVLSIVRDGDLSFDRACADINFESIDIIKKLLDSVEHLEAGDELPMPETYHSMLSVLIDVSDNKVAPADALSKRKGGPVAKAEPVVEEINPSDESRVDVPSKETIVESSKPEAKAEPSAAKDSVAQAPKSDSESSVRVSVNRLDRLIDMVGELVIAHSVVAQDQNIPNDSELQKKVNHATKILRELQDTSLTLRMVPLRATFHKMNRLVRDLSRKAGKPVKFSTTGEDTEIDRNMVDIINEPLIHMIRNSLDHGIETPEQREKTDKSTVANITLKAFQEGGKVVIQIQDDGRGINKDVILKKAIEKGLVDPEKKMTDSEIYGLIFLPGFSSAEKVTDLSGRGVGMDVVRRSIEQLQGKVEVASELGVGTTITIELPFTLAITDGILIRVGEERFIVPTINIDMTFRANPEDLFTILGESEQVSFRGRSVPVIRLHSLFEIEGAQVDILNGTMLVIKNNNNRYALLVDEVIGQQQLVGKSINMMNTTKHISGGAILGDGRVGLILDTAALTA